MVVVGGGRMEDGDDPPTPPSLSLSLIGGGTAAVAGDDGFMVFDTSNELGPRVFDSYSPKSMLVVVVVGRLLTFNSREIDMSVQKGDQGVGNLIDRVNHVIHHHILR
jgi:hypothetical protein